MPEHTPQDVARASIQLTSKLIETMRNKGLLSEQEFGSMLHELINANQAPENQGVAKVIGEVIGLYR